MQESAVKCPACGVENYRENKFCHKCGMLLHENDSVREVARGCDFVSSPLRSEVDAGEGAANQHNHTLEGGGDGKRSAGEVEALITSLSDFPWLRKLLSMKKNGKGKCSPELLVDGENAKGTYEGIYLVHMKDIWLFIAALTGAIPLLIVLGLEAILRWFSSLEVRLSDCRLCLSERRFLFSFNPQEAVVDSTFLHHITRIVWGKKRLSVAIILIGIAEIFINLFLLFSDTGFPKWFCMLNISNGIGLIVIWYFYKFEVAQICIEGSSSISMRGSRKSVQRMIKDLQAIKVCDLVSFRMGRSQRTITQ